ncbi:hypothetical protein Tco_0767744 [Tanacetum coccineum]
MVVKMISSLHSYQPCVAEHLGSVSRNLTVHFMFKLGIPTGTNPKRYTIPIDNPLVIPNSISRENLAKKVKGVRSNEVSLPEPRSPTASVGKLVDIMSDDRPSFRRIEALNFPKSLKTSGDRYGDEDRDEKKDEINYERLQVTPYLGGAAT